ncbi:MAG: glycosyltransferase family 2 protein [Cumulibacter sp.]
MNSSRPHVSIVVPVYRTDLGHLSEMIESAVAQSDGDWQLVLVDDASGLSDLESALDRAAADDPRIVVVHCEQNGGIGRATQIGIERATGELVALLDHDDVLDPEAVAELNQAARQNPNADVIYTDEYWWIDGQRHYFRKPDWSPERLRGQMYLGHIVAYRRDLLERIGGMRTGFDGSQDYDLALRATENAREVHHIRKALYSWRIHAGSVSHAVDNQPVFDAAIRALTEHLSRIGVAASAEQVRHDGAYRIRRVISGEPRVSVVIPTRGSRATIRGTDRCLVVETVRDIIEKSHYRNVEVVVVWDSGMDPEVLEELASIAGSKLVLVEFADEFNFSRKINAGAIAATGDYLLMLNDDVEVIDRDWIDVLLGLAQQNGVGMAGALMYFEDGRIQHAGHIYTGGAAGHAGFGLPPDHPGAAGMFQIEREVSGITAACAMVPAKVFFDLGGFSTTLPVNYNDVDFSLKVRQAGYRCVVSPFARMYHYESSTREPGVTPYEFQELSSRWERHMQVDPFD